MAGREGFNLCTLVYAIGLWMSDYCLYAFRETINTVYIVGDATTDADVFAQSILKIFHCVMTANINTLDVAEFAPIREVTKMIYFPMILHEPPFKNPLVNQLLAGRELNVQKDNELLRIEPIKCLVRLKNLPRPDHLPTGPKQHVIIRFNNTGTGYLWDEKEFSMYLQRIKDEEDETNFKCDNPYGVLCSSLDAVDGMCPVCSTACADLTSLTGTD
ncbi:hypothetical protein ORF12 [Aviadenovirus bubonis]|nr:hypothetical protein ORF12 [Owl adenovirus]